MQFEAAQGGDEGGSIVGGKVRELGQAKLSIGNAEPATSVHVANGVAVCAQAPHQVRHTLHGGSKRRQICNLRADVHANAGYFQKQAVGGAGVKAGCIVNGYPKLVTMQSGGDVGMSFRGNIGIDSQGDTGSNAAALGAFGQQLQLTLTLQVKQQDAGFEGRIHFSSSFAHAGKDDLPGGAAVRLQYALQFAAGDHVEAAA